MVGQWRVTRYLIAGSASLVFDLGLQWVFLSLVGLPVWLASAASYEIALLVHFFVNHRWVFGQRRPSVRRLVEFHAAALTGQVITLGVTNLLVSGPTAPHFDSGAGPYAAKIIGTGAAFSWNFASSFFWIWRPHRTVST